MTSPRASSLVVVAIAAVTGAGLARSAGAGVDTGGPVSSEALPPLMSTPASAAAGGSASREEGEPSDHGLPSADNPYEDTSQPRAAVSRVTVPLENGMLHLPGGRFTMGSAAFRAPANERPSRAAAVGSFWIDRTEVTVGAYHACVEAGACARPARSSSACTYDAGDPDMPVACVHWKDADAYCRFAAKRLPSEREWEYAARGTYPVSYPWGGTPSCANAATLATESSARTCTAGPTHVGSHPTGASTFGVQDMSGNVEEWTADWYTESVGPGPAPRVGAAHVLRGGGWTSPPSLSRTTSRSWGSALEAGPGVGFRCARD